MVSDEQEKFNLGLSLSEQTISLVSNTCQENDWTCSASKLYYPEESFSRKEIKYSPQNINYYHDSQSSFSYNEAKVKGYSEPMKMELNSFSRTTDVNLSFFSITGLVSGYG